MNNIVLSEQNCGYEVMPGSYINTYCGNSIKLDVGFHASLGSKFHAHIEQNPSPYNAHERKTNASNVRIKSQDELNVFAYPNPFGRVVNIGLTPQLPLLFQYCYLITLGN